MFYWRDFARLWGIKIAHCQFTNVHQWNPSGSHHTLIVSFACCPSTNHFPLSLIPLLLRQNKALEHLQTTSEKGQHCWSTRAKCSRWKNSKHGNGHRWNTHTNRLRFETRATLLTLISISWCHYMRAHNLPDELHTTIARWMHVECT